MRILELILVLSMLLSISPLFINPKRRSRWFHLSPTLSIVIALLQIIIEAYRWQMVPAYILSLLIFLFTIKNIRHFNKSSADLEIKDRKWLRLIGASTSILLLFITILPPISFPVFKLPVPSGSHNVGTMYDYFIDKDRKEYSTPDSTDYCEISAQIWYPAEISGNMSPTKYWKNASTKSAIITKFWGGLPSFLFNYFSLIETHSYLNANIAKAKQKYPVLIFNPGSVSVPSLYTALMEELASYGYIIFSIGHADYMPFFVKPDGQIKAFDPNNEEYLSKMSENSDDETREIFNLLMNSNDFKDQESLLRQFLERNPQNQKSILRWADDISFVVDELEKINNGKSILAGKLDLDRLGVFGQSFGGAASTQVCITDKRFKATVNIDCPQFGDLLDNDSIQPIMFMSSDQFKGKNDLFLKKQKNPLFMILVKGTTHKNFCDISFWGGILKKQMLGTIESSRCQEIQNNYIRAFFDKYLKEQESMLLVGTSSTYPEVEIQVANIQNKRENHENQ